MIPKERITKRRREEVKVSRGQEEREEREEREKRETG